MERLDSGSAVPAPLRGGIVALGNFDGFHSGHQAVVGRAIERARAEGRPALVATFDPHPARLFQPDSPPFLLSTIDQRAAWFAAAGVDAMFVIRFDREVAAVNADAFIDDWIIGRLGAAGVVTGSDFTFGHNREGDVAALAKGCHALGLSTESVAPVTDADGPVSSTRVREAVRAGRLDEAARLLTRPFAIEGVVQHGAKVGRELGFPTANLVMGDYLRPAYGIYAVRGHLPDGQILDGAANLGIRPSFDPPLELLEPHFFDFSGNLYGTKISVDLIALLRPELPFTDMDALSRQIAEDCDQARAVLAATPR